MCFIRTQEATSQPLDSKVTDSRVDTGVDNQNVEINSPDKSRTKLSLNHKELIEKIRKEKEKFIQEKKSQDAAEKQAKIEKLVNSSKVDDTGAKGITGGEPSDEITKERRNFIKKVGKGFHLACKRCVLTYTFAKRSA